MLNQNKSDKQLLEPGPGVLSADDFAHEFNNLLTAIISNLSLAKVDSPPESDLYKSLDAAEDAAHEAKELTKKFFLPNDTSVIGEHHVDDKFDQRNLLYGDQRVLVIDDDQRAGVAMCKMLEHLGLKVEYLKESLAAIERFKEAEHPFDLVVLDLMIPGKKATDTLKELRQHDASVKVIICSGYLNDSIMENFQEHGFKAAISKPYKVSELSQTLNQVLSVSS